MLPILTTLVVATIPWFILTKPVFSAPAALALPEKLESHEHLLDNPTAVSDAPAKRDASFVEVRVERDIDSDHAGSNVLTTPRKRQWGGGGWGGHRNCCGSW
jgi:hypothetical protein